MFFLVQANIYLDPDHYKIFDALKELNIDYEVINIPPGAERIDFETDRKNVFVYGSVTIARLAKQNSGWFPGSFYGGNHLYEVYSQYYGENLLNHKVCIHRISEQLNWKEGEKKFIKPYNEAKIFTGKVFTEIEWKDFVFESLESESNRITEQSLVQVSKAKQTIKEARLWIVGGQIIDGGYYKFNDNAPFEETVSDDGLIFANKMIELYNLEEAFVMDICLMNEGWKIVEINCINSSGFYPNTNVKSIIKALDIYFSK
ncbi:ATP-grasp domain-containing protein [Chryseobacterium sp. MEBOG06]|uniref:ATP-grasp domain-containing protein n=1 Tax=Chryseobacterium sp. MEBOG06 TaxID=2879938 RepID=UPI001F262F50|nr:ATP-grasp domain-containing protein [Chryseobacterium sp. MEBOG06]UKB84747.1 ATP-grasp domain-containing protein [Chryseobacterium sp. MEBOG06]